MILTKKKKKKKKNPINLQAKIIKNKVIMGNRVKFLQI